MERLEKDLADWAISSDGYLDEDEAVANKTIQQEINELDEVFIESGIEGLKQKLHDESEKWKKIKLNIAVTGSSGAGKSALINAILNLSPEDDERAAKVGVKETTVDLTPYHHAHNQNFIVWDMPGVGTPNFPKAVYFDAVKLDQYDFFLILSAGRFTEDDLWLAKEIRARKKRFYFIRTQIDTDILKDKKSKPRTHKPTDVINVVKTDCVTNLRAAGIEEPLVFLIDNYDKENQLFDFGQLQVQLLNDSDNLKVEAMALSLSVLTKEVLRKKMETLAKNITEKALEITCAFREPSEQTKLFQEEITRYKRQFDLEESTLQENKDILNISDENIEKFKNIVETLSADTMMKLRFPFSFHDKLVIWFLSKLGESQTSGIRFKFCCIALYRNLRVLYEEASKIYGYKAQKELSKSCLGYDDIQEHN